MSNVIKRLKKLEARWTDSSGLVVNSEKWFAYWETIIGRWLEEETEIFPGPFPLAVIDRLMERAGLEEERVQ